MTSPVETVGLEDRVAFALHKMDLGGYRHLPVMSEGRLAGYISVPRHSHAPNRCRLGFLPELRSDRARLAAIPVADKPPSRAAGMTSFRSRTLSRSTSFRSRCLAIPGPKTSEGFVLHDDVRVIDRHEMPRRDHGIRHRQPGTRKERSVGRLQWPTGGRGPMLSPHMIADSYGQRSGLGMHDLGTSSPRIATRPSPPELRNAPASWSQSSCPSGS